MESQLVEMQYQNLVFNLVDMVTHLRLPKRTVIKSDAMHTKMENTKTWLSMDMGVITMKFQNLLMKIQNIIDPKDTTVVLKVFSMILLLACLSRNNIGYSV